MAQIRVPEFGTFGIAGPLGLVISPGAAAISATCGCAKIGNYVAPNPGVVPGGNPDPSGTSLTSSSGKYRVTTSFTDHTTNVKVTRTKDGVVVFATSVTGTVGLGFSPDEDRFVYHYQSPGSLLDNVFVYDLTVKMADQRNLAPIAVTTQQSRLQFSPSGKYFLYTALTGPSHTILEIYQMTSLPNSPNPFRAYNTVGTATVTQGSTFAVDVNIANVTDLFAFQFDVGFNQNNLMATNVTEGTFLPSGGSTFFISGTIDNTNGVIVATADTLIGPGPGVSGSGTLAVFDFTAIGTGTTDLTVSNIILVDSAGNPINLVSNTPEPSTVILFALAALAVALKLRHT